MRSSELELVLAMNVNRETRQLADVVVGYQLKCRVSWQNNHLSNILCFDVNQR